MTIQTECEGHQKPVAKNGSTAWGNYRCELQDDEGFQWSIGTYIPGEPAW